MQAAAQIDQPATMERLRGRPELERSRSAVNDAERIVDCE